MISTAMDTLLADPWIAMTGIVAASASAVAGWQAKAMYTQWTRRQDLAAGAAQLKAARDAARTAWTDTAEDIPADLAADITAADATTLLKHMHSQRWSAVDVMRVYCARAKLAGMVLNSNAEEMFADAVAAAQVAEANIAAGRARPLEGLPISVKDQIKVAGTHATCGSAALAAPGEQSQEDALIVRLMRDAGAIPFVRGNVPQCLMLPETDNNVWGRAVNPWSKHRTPYVAPPCGLAH